MNAQKPSIPRGTRDFGPEKMVRRNFIFNHIREVFQLFGFLPMETPAMENLAVLTGKYGDEGDQLIFKILNSGNFLENAGADLASADLRKLVPVIAEKALRYDLTVPFARYVVMNRGSLTFPFKRYQIQPVWRADRPQKGRYREFYQCDADVVGTNSLICETEIIQMIGIVFDKLGIQDYSIKINHRKILDGIASLFNISSQLPVMTVAIDKLDKIGKEGVRNELTSHGLETGLAQQIVDYFTGYQTNDLDNTQKLEFFLKDFTSNNVESGQAGVQAIQTLLSYMPDPGHDASKVMFDISLARGLTYYTGTIFEVKANNVQIGSICGGGRYDNLTGVFGLPGVSGVGISFGVDRIFDVMEELNLFPGHSMGGTKVLLSAMHHDSLTLALDLTNKLRLAGIPAEVYPEITKLKRQLEYAHKKDIPFVIIIGEEELASGKLTFKNMLNGTQQRLSFNEIVEQIQST